MSKNTRPRALNVTELQVFAAALIKYFGTQALPINGSTVTPQQFKDKVDNYVVLLANAAAGKSAWSAQLTALDNAVIAFEPLVVSAHTYVRGVYGSSNIKLDEFGLNARKPTARSAAQQVIVNAKSAATRTARHTVGPKAKKAIHGTATAPLAPSIVKPGGDSTK
jgi:hypothetical protein